MVELVEEKPLLTYFFHSDIGLGLLNQDKPRLTLKIPTINKQEVVQEKHSSAHVSFINRPTPKIGRLDNFW